MKKVALLIVLIGNVVLAQESENSNNQVKLIKNSKSVFMKNSQEYKLKDYKDVFNNPEAILNIKQARRNKTFAEILGYVGGFGLGYGIGSAIGTKSSDPQAKSKRQTSWIIAGSGLCVLGASIPLSISASKKIKKAIDIENSQNENALSDSELNVIINGNGVGFSLSF